MPRPFIFVLHNHQPVGNFEHVFQDAFERCYRPVTDLIERFEPMKIGLHFSGPLLEWLKHHRPDYLERVARLVSRGQVEILGGGFYEPILSILPDHDATGQLEMMSMFCERHFGKRPEGMWLAERVWDPDLPRILAQAGLQYTLLDDSHFRAAGVPEDQIRGHYITEKAGHAMAILPIDKGLRYRIPFASADDVIHHVTSRSDDTCITYGDDGEKFGLWPDTYDWVFEKKWLETFFGKLCHAQEEGKIRTVLPGAWIREARPMGRVYLPNASYEEMMEWALPPERMHELHDFRESLKKRGEYDTYGPFVRGAMWQSFLAKYPEANQIHKKMLYVSSRLSTSMDEAVEKSGDGTIRGDTGDLLGTAQRALYRGQCCCAYWHGLFGGLYLNYLRHALYESLLSAESILDRLQQGEQDWVGYEQEDIDIDGRDEVILSNRFINAYVRPHGGGAMFELDYKPKSFNLTNVLTRRAEGYHRHAKGGAQGSGGDAPKTIHDMVRVKEQGLERFLVYDDVPRWSAIDRFLPEDVTLEGLRGKTTPELGDFTTGDYRVKEVGVGGNKAKLVLERVGAVRRGDRWVTVRATKIYTVPIDRRELTVAYELESLDEPLSGSFGCELNLSLLAGSDPSRYLRINRHDQRFEMQSEGVSDDVFEIALTDEWAKLEITVAFASARLFRYPIETVSQSESGLERTYQGTCFLPVFRLDLAPGAPRSFELVVSVSDLV